MTTLIALYDTKSLKNQKKQDQQIELHLISLIFRKWKVEGSYGDHRFRFGKKKDFLATVSQNGS